jgi:hypothetical protein
MIILFVLLGFAGVLLSHVLKPTGRHPWIFVLFVGYTLSYGFLSFLGQHEGCDVSALGQPRRMAWAFQGIRQVGFEDTVTERALFFMYYPLIRLDRRHGYLHVLDGGDALLEV